MTRRHSPGLQPSLKNKSFLFPQPVSQLAFTVRAFCSRGACRPRRWCLRPVTRLSRRAVGVVACTGRLPLRALRARLGVCFTAVCGGGSRVLVTRVAASLPIPVPGTGGHKPSLACAMDALSCLPGCRILSSDPGFAHGTQSVPGKPAVSALSNQFYHTAMPGSLFQDLSSHWRGGLPGRFFHFPYVSSTPSLLSGLQGQVEPRQVLRHPGERQPSMGSEPDTSLVTHSQSPSVPASIPSSAKRG